MWVFSLMIRPIGKELSYRASSAVQLLICNCLLFHLLRWHVDVLDLRRALLIPRANFVDLYWWRFIVILWNKLIIERHVSLWYLLLILHLWRLIEDEVIVDSHRLVVGSVSWIRYAGIAVVVHLAPLP